MRAVLAFILMTVPAVADHVQITLIDARTLTVEQVKAMAIAERGNAQAHSCCDWGGLGCRVETLAGMMSRPATTPEE